MVKRIVYLRNAVCGVIAGTLHVFLSSLMFPLLNVFGGGVK